MNVMQSTSLMAQTPGVGRCRDLSPAECDHFICVLRAVERLPLLSALPEWVDKVLALPLPQEFAPLEAVLRQLVAIHNNHIEFANEIGRVLTDH